MRPSKKINKLSFSTIFTLSYVFAILSLLGALSLFYLTTENQFVTTLLFLLPLFAVGAVILSIIDFVLVIENPKLKRKLLPILSMLLSIIAFLLYIGGLARISP